MPPPIPPLGFYVHPWVGVGSAERLGLLGKGWLLGAMGISLGPSLTCTFHLCLAAP